MPSFSANDIPLTECYISDSTWPSTLVLDLRSSNWAKWSHRLEVLASRTGLDPWLKGTLSPPDPNLKMANSWVWWTNNNLLRRFIIQHISTYDFDIISPLALASEIYNILRTRHEKLGLHAHVVTVRRDRGSK
jgi:hypothetical protein